MEKSHFNNFIPVQVFLQLVPNYQRLNIFCIALDLSQNYSHFYLDLSYSWALINMVLVLESQMQSLT